MFTGLVEAIGTVEAVTDAVDSRTMHIAAPAIMNDVAVDDSIAVNGCCLTVTWCDHQSFRVTAVAETLRKTTLGTLQPSSTVNVERALRIGDRLGGHLVQGHVDVVGTVVEVIPRDAGRELRISIPASFRQYLIPTGSVTVDGISLTVANLSDRGDEHAWFHVAIIPHTLAVTTIGQLRQGALVNVEFDVMGKYALQRM